MASSVSPDAVSAAASRLQPGDVSAIQLTVRGTIRQLEQTVYREALAILCEAIVNAYSHAQPSKIEVELEYGRREFRCIVRDDGVGIPPEILDDGGRQNHWGLRGMAERAAWINARLALKSCAGAGTELQLALAAALAYTR